VETVSARFASSGASCERHSAARRFNPIPERGTPTIRSIQLMPLSSCETFAGYRIVRLLGSGGRGEVDLAEHPRLPRRDALKVLPADISGDPDYRARFNREAELVSKLWHPHIVSVHDRGEYYGQLWISMDFVDGLDAARLLASRFPDGMPADQVMRIVTAVASALDYAHKQGLLHRDVKPANIMITHLDDDDEQRILLADFGIARNIDDISGLTATNMTLGTVAYCAPEQLMGEEIDGRADEYALAATAYHLLTGSQLFLHSNPAVVISHHLNSPPPALADTRPELAALDPVLARALAKNPDDRFPRCSDFARALAEPSYKHGSPSPIAATKPAPVPRKSTAGGVPPTGGEPPHRVAVSSSRRRWLLATAALAVILLASVIARAWRPWESGRSTGATTTSGQRPAASSSSSAPPPPPVFPAKAIDSILLTPDEVNGILGTYGMRGNQRVGQMKVDQSTYGMADNSSLVKPPSCVGVVFGAEHEVYADTGSNAMRDQTFTKEFYLTPTIGNAPAALEQTVIVFPSGEQAQAVVASAQSQWRSCAGGEVGQSVPPEDAYTWKLGSVERQGDLLTVPMASKW
jgi:serine/threonine protein kinase